MLYIIMAGGDYDNWPMPKQMAVIYGEPLIARTIRQLRKYGVENIAISSQNPIFEQFGVPVLKHNNEYVVTGMQITGGYWCNAFYPKDCPVCYIFGDVVFTNEAIETIVKTETDDIEFFASAPPFAAGYPKPWAEPFALKVQNTGHLKSAIQKTKELADQGKFYRKPIMWELWQVIKDTPLNRIDYGNYTVINDTTCDIDTPEDVEKLNR